MSTIISVQLDRLDALAAELGELGAQLGDCLPTGRGAAATLAEALGGPAGDTAAGVATAWSSVLGLLAHRTDAAAAALVSAVAAYRAADAAMADRFCPADPGYTPPRP